MTGQDGSYLAEFLEAIRKNKIDTKFYQASTSELFGGLTYTAPQSEILVNVNPKYFRPSEVDLLLGDSSKAQKLLGWQRKISFRELVKMMVRADIELVEEGKFK